MKTVISTPDAPGAQPAVIRASAQQMLSLWGYADVRTAPATAKFFYNSIRSGAAVFWALSCAGQLVGELYVFYRLEDGDFADGRETAYLCAFRVQPAFRGRGLGMKLLCQTLEQLQRQGYKSATIGADVTNDAALRLYRRLGFTQTVKQCCHDPCDRDAAMQLRTCPPFLLLRKQL